MESRVEVLAGQVAFAKSQQTEPSKRMTNAKPIWNGALAVIASAYTVAGASEG